MEDGAVGIMMSKRGGEESKTNQLLIYSMYEYENLLVERKEVLLLCDVRLRLPLEVSSWYPLPATYLPRARYYVKLQLVSQRHLMF